MINHQYQSLDLTVKGYAKTDMTKIFTEWFEKNHEDINIPFTLCKNYISIRENHDFERMEKQ